MGLGALLKGGELPSAPQDWGSLPSSPQDGLVGVPGNILWSLTSISSLLFHSHAKSPGSTTLSVYSSTWNPQTPPSEQRGQLSLLVVLCSDLAHRKAAQHKLTTGVSLPSK